MTAFNEVAKEIHENAVAHGWWDEKGGFPEVLALIHSEVFEALEEYRGGDLAEARIQQKPPVSARRQEVLNRERSYSK